MANPTTKQELLAAMADGYAQLNEQIAKMSEAEHTAPFSFAADPKKCGVRWQNDRCLRDLLIHLYEWQLLMSTFVKNILEGHPKDYLPDEYRKNYHEMDRMIVEKHQNTSLEEAQSLLQQGHEDMCSHLQKKLFEENGVYHSLWMAMQDDPELTAAVRSRQLHIYRNGKKVLVLAGKSAPKIIQDDNLVQYL